MAAQAAQIARQDAVAAFCPQIVATLDSLDASGR